METSQVMRIQRVYSQEKWVDTAVEISRTRDAVLNRQDDNDTVRTANLWERDILAMTPDWETGIGGRSGSGVEFAGYLPMF